MRDIRIVHDRIGSYADWLADDNDPTIQEQWLIFYWDKYLTGKLPPNYQVPAIITEVAMWRNHVAFYKDTDIEPFKMWIEN